MRWRPWEIAYLEAHAGDGAEAVASHLGRTVNSVQIQASRIGVSLRRVWECPRCGQKVYTPLSGVSGWCMRCHLAESRDTAAEANRRIREKIAAEEREIAAIKRERQRYYSDTTRKRQKLKKLRKSRES
ncbi:hypothetical protein [Adlercreutzia shanghongiae]|uniref:Uncharacterized protein n=1 Tax=Adlercreutzia shanghongiae TaxID=3111773 RepID=A0ABU6IWD9_9ACTN|nr:hypothetical protein [Adlercreutzia sp. R22]MEC4294016.1 hypothetical protein [Adlercreutzia sp. R22]